MDLELKLIYLKDKGAKIPGTNIDLPKGAMYALLYEKEIPQKAYRIYYIMNAKVIDVGDDFIIFETDGKEIENVITMINKSKYPYLKAKFIQAYKNAKRKTESESKEKKTVNSPSQDLDTQQNILIEMSIEYLWDGRKFNCYIAQKETKGYKGSSVYHYTSLEARELLSALFISERKKKGDLNHRNFKINAVKYYTKDGKMPEDMRPTKLILQQYGGMYISSHLNQEEIVDLLLYSPYTERYEIIKATKSKTLDYCYTDVKLFREFVAKYGNPGLKIEFRATNTDAGLYMDLQEKSILNEFGYSVDKANNLSEKDRQEILAEIIDLSILRQDEVLRYLYFFISSHKGEKYRNARLKWQEDYNFVLHYKQNVERFLIAKT